MNSINGSKARADALPFELKFEPTFERKVQRRIRLAWLALLISGVVLLWWSEFSRWGLAVEFWVSRQFYQAGVGFPLRDSAQFDFWWHIFPKRMMFLLPLWALLQIIYGFVLRHQNRLAGIRRDEWLRWCAIFFIGLLTPVLLSVLKKWTNQACPWSLSDFGGTLPYVHLLDPRPWAARTQACWPAGHAAVGLSMLVVSFVGGWQRALWRDEVTLAAPRSPWLSAGAFAAYAVVLSMVLGFSQVMRGAHFISHQVWSLWIVLVFNMLFVQLGVIKTRWWRSDRRSHETNGS